MKNAKLKAVIYCRVSSQKQVKKGDGLGSQETRCRDYAKHKGYEVVSVFRDEGVSGSMINRPSMQEMLSFLKRHKRKEEHVVIIDDISRLARDLEAHIQLRTAISGAGGKLESPSIEFGEDSDSRLVENLLASVSQHHRQKNAEQVTNRMQARVMNGYWVFSPPTGYRFERIKGHGKMLVRDEPIASIVQEALEGYAHGRFETPSEVMRFLESFPEFPRDREGNVPFQLAQNMLRRSLYAGYIDVKKWDISLHPAKHDPLISFEIWQRIQNRLNEKPQAPTRKDLNKDFPLRGFITCGCCATPLTANWSKGRSASYAYYLCRNKSCTEYKKSIRKEDIEAEFESLLLELKPTPDLFYMAKGMFQKLWEERGQLSLEQAHTLKLELGKIDKKVEQFLERIIEADSHTVIKAYENQVKKLEEEKITISENIAQCGRPLPDFDDTFRTALDFLANPYKLWCSDRYEDKRIVLKLTFADQLSYVKNEGFRTAAISQPFLLLEELKGVNGEMVDPIGIEPTTSSLPAKRSPS